MDAIFAERHKDVLQIRQGKSIIAFNRQQEKALGDAIERLVEWPRENRTFEVSEDGKLLPR